MITVEIIPIIETNQNYAYLIQTDCGKVAVLDPGEADPIIDILEQKNITPDYILITHHHWDHVNGIPKIKKKYDCPVVIPKAEESKIKYGDITLNDGDVFELGEEKAHIILTPGHTAGGICYYFPDSNIVFTGDTLFSLGCGRLFEGTAEDMFTSFEKLKKLPDGTLVYCGHEYTRANAGFCLSVAPDNAALKQRIAEVKTLRAENKPTLPTTIGIEKKTNVFMQTKTAQEFGDLRRKKDNF
ncbi:MAG: hydroxyacylglutathione hydrolase [Alcanivorax sp.]